LQGKGPAAPAAPAGRPPSAAALDEISVKK
jgi:hypothetical protein